MIYKPPMNIAERDITKKYIFLAGSIEMGKAIDWQTLVTNSLKDLGYGIFNPRREDRDLTWEQKFDNPQFYQQVNWELDALEKCDIILLNLLPETKSPISLLELGLHALSKKIYVVCPEGFWRKGNVDIVCHRYNIPLFKDINDFLQHIKQTTK